VEGLLQRADRTGDEHVALARDVPGLARDLRRAAVQPGGVVLQAEGGEAEVEQYFLVKENALDYQYGGKKVSYEEFMEIYEKSTLRMELINGEIYLLASPSMGHQQILGGLYLGFTNYFKGKKCRVFLAPFDVHFRKKDINEPDVMQPDVLVACDVEGNVNKKGKYMGTPTLVVEILSDSTRSKDMITKLDTYRLSGVKEYWVIDQKQEQILIYEFENCEIGRFQAYGKADAAKSLVFAGLSVNVKELFSELSSFSNESKREV
jgi:Uma2 family endonuclease